MDSSRAIWSNKRFRADAADGRYRCSLISIRHLTCQTMKLTGTFLSPRNAPARTYKFMRIQATASRRKASSDSDACSFSER